MYRQALSPQVRPVRPAGPVGSGRNWPTGSHGRRSHARPDQQAHHPPISPPPAGTVLPNSWRPPRAPGSVGAAAITTLAPTLGVLHPAADRPAPGQPAHRGRLPRYLPAGARVRPRHHWYPVVRASPGRPRRAANGAFLHYLKCERVVAASTRNARLAAIRSFYRFAAFGHPDTRRRTRRLPLVASALRRRRTGWAGK